MPEIETLRKLGLTEYESIIVLTLLQFGSCKVSEIAKKCAVPKNKIYECLSNLSKKGIAKEIPSIPKKYFMGGINSLRILLKEKEEQLTNLKTEISQLERIKRDKLNLSVNEPVGIVYGHEAFINKLRESISLVSKENLIIMKKVRADPVIVRLTHEAIKRGAKVKMLVQITDSTLLKEWKEIGVKIKFLKEKPDIVFSTFDNKICRLNLDITNKDSDPTLWIENAAFIQILREKFYSLWKESKTSN